MTTICSCACGVNIYICWHHLSVEHAGAHTHTREHLHTYTTIHVHTQVHTYTHTHTHTHMHTYTHTTHQTHTLINVHTHVRTRTHKHTHNLRCWSATASNWRNASFSFRYRISTHVRYRYHGGIISWTADEWCDRLLQGFSELQLMLGEIHEHHIADPPV